MTLLKRGCANSVVGLEIAENSRPKNSTRISPVFRQLLRLHVWDILEHSVQYFLHIVSQTHQLKPTIDMCCYHVQEELLGSTNSRIGLVGTGGVDRELDHEVARCAGARPGSNSLDSIARFALPRVNTAPKPIKCSFGGFFSQK